MAQVNFTLDDFRQVIRQEVKPMIEESELRITRAVAASFSEYEAKYDARFDRVDQRLDALTGEVKAIRKLVGLHSKEIMELKARTS